MNQVATLTAAFGSGLRAHASRSNRKEILLGPDSRFGPMSFSPEVAISDLGGYKDAVCVHDTIDLKMDSAILGESGLRDTTHILNKDSKRDLEGVMPVASMCSATSRALLGYVCVSLLDELFRPRELTY